MSENFIVRTINLDKHYIAASRKYKKGGRLLFTCASEAIHEQGFFHPDKMVRKQIKRDMLLRKILKDATNKQYVTLKSNIESEIRDATKILINDNGELVDRNVSNYSKAIGKVEEKIHRHIVDFDNEANKIIVKKANAYIADRVKSKLQVQTLRIKKVKKVFLAGTAVVSGVGGGIMMTILTGGAAVPGLIGGCYASYQACKDAVDVFRRSHKDIADVADSIQKTILKLDGEYETHAPGPDDHETSSKKKQKMNRRELKAAAANIFLSTNAVTSLKKLKVDAKNFDTKTKIMIYNASRTGKRAGDLHKELKKLKSVAAAIQKNANSSEAQKILKKLNIKDMAPSMSGIQKEIDAQRLNIKNLISEAVDVHKKAKKYQEDIVVIQKAIEDISAGMPDAVNRGKKALHLAHFFIGIAPTAAGAGTMGVEFAKTGEVGMKQMFELHNTFVDTVNTVKDEVGIKGKKLKKVKPH